MILAPDAQRPGLPSYDVSTLPSEVPYLAFPLTFVEAAPQRSRTTGAHYRQANTECEALLAGASADRGNYGAAWHTPRGDA